MNREDANKVSDIITRVRRIFLNFEEDFCDLTINAIAAAANGELDLDKLLNFEENDFVHDIQILRNWDRDVHNCLDEHALLRSSPDVNMFRNSYECSCGHKWENEWEGTPNDRCPKCNLEIQPTCSEDLGDSNG